MSKHKPETDRLIDAPVRTAYIQTMSELSDHTADLSTRHFPDADKHVVRKRRWRIRSHLLDIAAPLFKARGLADMSLSKTAQDGDSFPTEVTYYLCKKKRCLSKSAAAKFCIQASRQKKLRPPHPVCLFTSVRW